MSFQNIKTSFSADAQEFVPSFLKSNSKPATEKTSTTSVNTQSSSTSTVYTKPYTTFVPKSYYPTVQTKNNDEEDQIDDYDEEEIQSYEDAINYSYPQNMNNYSYMAYPYLGYSYPAYGPNYAYPSPHAIQSEYHGKSVGRNLHNRDINIIKLSIGPEEDESNGIYKMCAKAEGIVRFSLEFLLNLIPNQNSIPDLELPPSVKLNKNQHDEHPKNKKKSKGDKSKTKITPRNPNAWTPTIIAKKTEDKNEITMKKLKSLLNKITPDNFSRMVLQTREISVTDEKTVKQCMDLIVKKAVKEPDFSELYVKYILQISDTFYTPTHTPIKTVSHTSPTKSSSSSLTVMSTVLNNLYTRLDYVPEKIKMDFPDDSAEEGYRRELVGICHFVGELYKKNVFGIDVIDTFLINLLNPTSLSTYLEAGCKLVSIVAAEIEKKERKHKEYINHYIDLFKCQLNRGDLDTRIRVLIYNILEDSKNKWIPRRRETDPKTLKEFYHTINRSKTTNTKRVEFKYIPTISPASTPSTHVSTEDNDIPTTCTISTTISKDNDSFIPIQNIRKKILSASLKTTSLSVSKDETESVTEAPKTVSQDKSVDDEEKTRKELQSITREYFKLNNMTELNLSLDELLNKNKYIWLIEIAICISLDMQAEQRELAVKLIQYLYIYSKCNIEGIMSSLYKIHGDMEEILIDVPKAKLYIKEILEKLCENNDIRDGLVNDDVIKSYMG